MAEKKIDFASFLQKTVQTQIFEVLMKNYEVASKTINFIKFSSYVTIIGGCRIPDPLS
jgi:hypothetical protein